MIDPAIEFRRELTAVAEREWEKLSKTERLAILLDYDVRALTENMEFAIFVEQWRRERGG